MPKRKSLKNTEVIRADGDVFIPELNIFKESNHLETFSTSELTRELGKLIRRLRMEKGKLRREGLRF